MRDPARVAVFLPEYFDEEYKISINSKIAGMKIILPGLKKTAIKEKRTIQAIE